MYVRINLDIIWMGVFAFPVIAFLITAPYLIFQYRKYGSIHWWKSFLFYAFIFYLICIYFFVILPLPENREMFTYYSAEPQLVPFFFFWEILGSMEGSLSDPSTWLQLAENTNFFIALYNLILLVPFGAILRYYFNRPWYQVLILGFALSAFFEITQLTGLYGLYEHPYRLFDVDDLILNTLGAMCGYLMMGPAVKLLPSIPEANEHAYQKGIRPSFLRRILSLLLDVAFFSLLDAAARLLLALFGVQDLSTLFTLEGYFSVPLLELTLFLLLFVCVPVYTHGQTLGQKALKLVMAKADTKPAHWYHFFVRHTSLPILLFVGIVLPNALINMSESSARQLGTIGQFFARNQTLLIFIWAALVLLWIVIMIIRNQRSKHVYQPFVLLNELVSNTRTYSLRQLDELRRKARGEPSAEKNKASETTDAPQAEVDADVESEVDVEAAPQVEAEVEAEVE